MPVFWGVYVSDHDRVTRSWLPHCASRQCAPAQSHVLGKSPASSQEAQNGVFRPAPSEQQGPEPGRARPHQPTPVYSIGKEYRVGANDLLDIEVLEPRQRQAHRPRQCRRVITLPLIGAVAVAGLTQQQVESRVAAMYGEKYLQNPQVSVFIKEFTTERITVDGAVAKPGIYPLVGPDDAAAGAGAGRRLRRRSPTATQVMLFRKGENGERQVATFDVEQIRAGQDEDPVIRGDDLIVVQRDSTRAPAEGLLFRDVVDPSTRSRTSPLSSAPSAAVGATARTDPT